VAAFLCASFLFCKDIFFNMLFGFSCCDFLVRLFDAFLVVPKPHILHVSLRVIFFVISIVLCANTVLLFFLAMVSVFLLRALLLFFSKVKLYAFCCEFFSSGKFFSRVLSVGNFNCEMLANFFLDSLVVDF